MKIGLVRHFKVKKEFPKKILLSKNEVVQWFEEYDRSELEYKTADWQIQNWKICLTSPLLRAVKTAKTLFQGQIVEHQALREFGVAHLLPAGIRLPFLVWAIWVRVKFLSDHPSVREFREKISLFVEELLTKNEDVLVVSHAFVMECLQKELLKKGFRGEKFKNPKNGNLYVFEKE